MFNTSFFQLLILLLFLFILFGDFQVLLKNYSKIKYYLKSIFIKKK